MGGIVSGSVPALIIALVVLVLVAIGTVVRLLIAEMAKPTQGQAKTVRKPAPGAVAAGVAVGASAATAGMPSPARAPATQGAPRPAGAVAIAPAPAAAPRSAGRVKKARMRDVVERGDGVRVSPWRRIRSALSLLVLVLVIGAGVAAVVGGFVVLIAFALEQAVN